MISEREFELLMDITELISCKDFNLPLHGEVLRDLFEKLGNPGRKFWPTEEIGMKAKGLVKEFPDDVSRYLNTLNYPIIIAKYGLYFRTRESETCSETGQVTLKK